MQQLLHRSGSTLLVLAALLLTTLQTHAAEPIQSPNDTRAYRALELNNGLKALLISDPETDRAAASLEVGVGSGDDPEHSQGLAHFLEHMLFLGTDRYPEAGAYQAFLSQHGGNHNAFTAHDRTNYFFDIEHSQLEPALDRFSRFFVAPLFSPEYVDRERHAVHSEYQSKLKEDGRRQYAVLREVINPEHPLATFAVGSLDTLQDNAQGKLTDHLQRFYQQHYSADNMSLVVLGAESLDQLQTLVEQRFAEVSKRNLSQRPAAVPLFKPGSLPALLQIKTLKELRELSFSFPVEPIRPYYDRKPLHYISALLGHEGEGSLLAELKRRGWANNLSAGPGFNYADSATLSVNIGLTREGMDHYPKITELLFQQLERIRREGVQRWRFDEEKQLSEIAFRFKETSNPLYEVLRLAGKLREYPVTEWLHGDYLYAEFDPELIHHYLDQLHPQNLLLTLSAQEVKTDSIEPRYQVPYRIQPLGPQLLTRLEQAEPHPALTIAAPNPFIPQNLSLLPAAKMSKPEQLHIAPGFKLWHQQDDEFRVPKADFYFTFRSISANDSARHHLLTQLLTRLVDDQLNAFLYPATEAGLSSSIYAHARGFSVRISGYNDRQRVLLERVLDTLVGLQIDPQRLQIHQQRLRRKLQNRSKDKPYNQAFDALYQRVLTPRWSTEQQLAELDSINAKELQSFKQQLLAVGNIEALAHGNLNQSQALALADIVKSRLLKSLTPVDVAPARARLLPQGSETLELSIEHNDSSLVLYLQGAQKSIPLRARYGLLTKVLEAPFYTELRTEKQRGYIVFATPMPIQEHPALAFVIQSPSTHPNILLNDVEQFLQRSQQLVDQLDDAALSRFKQGLISELLKREQKLSQRSSRYWQEIDKGYSDFDSRQQLAAAIDTVSLEQLQQTFAELRQRQLVVQSSGSGAQLANAADKAVD